MKLLTWNLNGLDDAKLDQRSEAAVFIAATGLTLRQLASGKRGHHPPDVLAFQEVVERSFDAHLRVHLPRAGYTLYPSEPPAREVFEVIAVRQPATVASAVSVPLEHSLYGRYVHIVEVQGLGGIAGSLRVLTAHFDSGPEEGSIRVAEARQVLAAMNARSIFAGDTNMRDSEWAAVVSMHPDGGISDAWEVVGRPNELKRTWRSFGRGARFDRIWLGADVAVRAMVGIGGKPLPGLADGPSDHIGLVVDVAERPTGDLR